MNNKSKEEDNKPAASCSGHIKPVVSWIDMKHELPPFHTDILFCVGGDVMKGWFYANSHKFREYYKNSVAEFYKSEVTHWMPLPIAP